MLSWAKVANGAVIVAPGAITEGETEADGWLTVRDLEPLPGAGETGDATLTVRADCVERTWSHIRPYVPPVDPVLAARRAALATVVAATPADPVVAALAELVDALALPEWR